MKITSVVALIALAVGVFLGYKLKPDQDAKPIVQAQAKCEATVKKLTKPDGTIEEFVIVSAGAEAKANPAKAKDLKNSLILQQDQLSYSRKVADIDLLGAKLEVATLVQARKDKTIHLGIELRF